MMKPERIGDDKIESQIETFLYVQPDELATVQTQTVTFSQNPAKFKRCKLTVTFQDHLIGTKQHELIMLDMRNFCKGLLVFGTIYQKYEDTVFSEQGFPQNFNINPYSLTPEDGSSSGIPITNLQTSFDQVFTAFIHNSFVIQFHFYK